jgi:hypothetical protein
MAKIEWHADVAEVQIEIAQGAVFKERTKVESRRQAI